MTIYERPMQANHQAHLATAALDRADAELSRALMMDGTVDWERARTEFERLSTNVIETIAVVAERSSSKEARGMAEQVTKAVADWRDMARARIGTAGQPVNLFAIPSQRRLETATAEIHRQTDLLTDLLLEQITADGYVYTAAIGEQVDSSVLIGRIIIALIALVSVALALLLSFDITGGLRQAVGIADRIAGGDFGVTIDTRRRDEFGKLLKSLDAMRTALRERMDTERRHNDEQMAEQSRRNMDQQRMAEASRVFGEAIKGRFEELSTRLKALSSESEVLAGVAAEATRMSHSAETASCAAISDVGAVSEATQGLAAAVSKISSQVSRSTEVTREAVGEAEGVSRTVIGLRDAAGRVGEIVGLISGIAGQTNLLALTGRSRPPALARPARALPSWQARSRRWRPRPRRRPRTSRPRLARSNPSPVRRSQRSSGSSARSPGSMRPGPPSRRRLSSRRPAQRISRGGPIRRRTVSAKCQAP